MINLTCDKQWLVFGHIYLTVEDKDIVVNGSVLNDKHINYGLNLIRNQYSDISGLQSTLLQRSRKVSPFLAGENALQVIHCLECHWIVASTIPIGENSCDVLIYDSFFASVDQATVGLLEKLFGRKIKIVMQNIQKQAGTTRLWCVCNCNINFIGMWCRPNKDSVWSITNVTTSDYLL